MFFDASDYVEEVLEIGVEYPATVTEVTEGVSKLKETPYIKIQFTIFGEKNKGWKVDHSMWQTDKSVGMNKGFLKSFNKATGQMDESFETKEQYMNHFLEQSVCIVMKPKPAYGEYPAGVQFQKVVAYDSTKTNNGAF